MPGLTSAAGLIGLLDEPDEHLRSFALLQLDKHVHQFWPEIADEVSKMCVACLPPSPTYLHVLLGPGPPPSSDVSTAAFYSGVFSKSMCCANGD